MSRLIKQIPDEWKARNFDEVFEFLPTLTLSRKDLNSDSEFDGIYNIHYGDIHSTYKFVELDFDKEKSIPKIIDDKIDELKLTFLTTGDLVIADASEDYEGVAACVELSNVKDRKVTAGLHTYAVRDKKGYSSEGFRAYILKHPWVNNEVNKIATGSKVYGISKTNISKLKVILPPLQEQQKIATILSKWDELIETQTQLIVEKEKQKKGLMQKLLTGEVRFPGFEEEWEEIELGEVGEVINGLTYSPNDIHEEGVLVLRSSNVQNRRLSFKSNVFVNVEEGKFNPVLENDILICVRNGSQSLIGKNALIDKQNEGVAFGAFMTVYRSKFNSFFFHLFDTPIYNKEVYKNLGATINSINGSELKKFKMPFPSIEEQNKITSLLESIDLEVKIYTEELESIKLQKKGLMQQLLTGRIRVKI